MNNENRIEEVLENLELVEHRERIEFFSIDDFTSLKECLEGKGYSVTLLGREHNDEFWEITYIEEPSEKCMLQIQNGRIVPYTLDLFEINEFVVISDDNNLSHELFHVKDTIENPKLRGYVNIMRENVLRIREDYIIDHHYVLNILLDFSINTRINEDEKHHLEELNQRKIRYIATDPFIWGLYFEFAFELFILCSGNIEELPDEIKHVRFKYRVSRFFFENQRLQRFIERVRGNFLSNELLHEFINIINGIITDIRQLIYLTILEGILDSGSGFII